MNFLPCGAELWQMNHQDFSNMPNFATGESVILAQLNGAQLTAQIEHRFCSSSNHMYVRRSVIIGIDHDP